MKKFYSILILAMVCLFVLVSNTYSQVPDGFNYQAVARDVTGQVIENTALPVRIAIVDAWCREQLSGKKSIILLQMILVYLLLFLVIILHELLEMLQPSMKLTGPGRCFTFVQVYSIVAPGK